MQKFSTRGLFLLVCLSLLVAGVTVVALIPSARNKVRQILLKEDREIIAKTSGHINKEGFFVSVFKIRENGRLFLEIYSLGETKENLSLLQKIELQETRDGYFSFMGNATNLALSDTDGDGHLEILAPTFDSELTARLNVFYLNMSTGLFERKLAEPSN